MNPDNIDEYQEDDPYRAGVDHSELSREDWGMVQSLSVHVPRGEINPRPEDKGSHSHPKRKKRRKGKNREKRSKKTAHKKATT